MIRHPLSLVTSGQRDTSSYVLDSTLRDQLARIPVDEGHSAVAQALTAAVDPTFTFHFGKEYDEESHRSGRILAPSGAELGASAYDWLRDELTRAGDQWRQRYRELASGEIVRTEFRIQRLYFFARRSKEAADFLQALVYVETEFPAMDWGPEMRSAYAARDVWDYATPDESALAITPPTYRLQQVERLTDVIVRDISVHRLKYGDELAWASRMQMGVIDFDSGYQGSINLKTLHNMPDLPPPTKLQRWFFDWSRSSAGMSGAKPEDHWFFSIFETIGKDNPICEVIPGWVTQKTLPKLDDETETTSAELVQWLEAFDSEAGHPFAWFFFLLHGNRISRIVGDRIVRAVIECPGWIPKHDRQVVAEWAARRYGF